jgi:hypothetical protein
MEPWLLAAILKPFVLFLLAACVLYPARKAVERWWPSGTIKRVLLFRVSEADSYRRTKRGSPAERFEQRVVR